MEDESIFDFGYPCAECKTPCSNSKQCGRWVEWFEIAWRRVVKPFRDAVKERDEKKHESSKI